MFSGAALHRHHRSEFHYGFVPFAMVVSGDASATEANILKNERAEQKTLTQVTSHHGSRITDEILRATHRDIETMLHDEQLDRLVQASRPFFESTIVNQSVNIGYGGSREDCRESTRKKRDNGFSHMRQCFAGQRCNTQTIRWRPYLKGAELPESACF